MARLKQFLLSILAYFRSKKSYSQDGEDVALAAFFEHKKGYKGFFVDVGAHHPVRFSNTWRYYRAGWRGINIDPTPGSMRPFSLWRRRDINLEIGIGATSSSMTFFCFNEPALNTFDPAVAKQRNTGKPYKIIRELEVGIEPLRNVLGQYLPAGVGIDFLTVDVEGLDLVVLESNDWERFAPTYVLVEDYEFTMEAPENSAIYKFLKHKGYHIAAVLKRTIIYSVEPSEKR
jgi:hypothetical protein